ncbi:undecaprenyldiphospho-muramoylpentapeptide beta-N-acetylglucosaminyltransferase [Clostridium sp. CM027]|uniref:undecaprenyldiphospho-muramoylpentapeptide beta-N-acetylglucosaminyltransferase n=1 Tax=Clostridium sp. CM027 TaxID=2849865 RepID=UPI001C6F049A|nr:undecaprenyldiphospho-muramoylpentapeptide beta-N-acetylglucosaminyltransferase [Clostridium sp. CM027]MBW9144698.1 undecaprenyldiphospho-muramoylpentapeptide beta-N-acetylglucosaminyltransferase [Clostridium sp. CM027]UVE40552.1 undecaprenyldiphospho-muramoylpentapeptide beta-N-acetylglucosaminyltransferase [Clostridium sp. CM027]
MKIVLTGGGTAGHAMVNKILIPLLKNEGLEVVYIGSGHGIEKEMIENQGLATYHAISTGKLRRYFSLKNVTDIFRVLKGIYQSYKIIRKEQPTVVMSGGGFVSVPVIIASWVQHIPSVIRETDVTIGLANRICMKFAKKVFVTFPSTKFQVTSKKRGYCGMIIRPELLNVQNECIEDKAFKNCNPTLLVLGGSLGSAAINNKIWECLSELLEKYNIIHICGKGKLNNNLPADARYRQYEYVDDMSLIYAISDIVIIRCGSNAIAEGISIGKRMICVPLSRKSSRGEQELNAQYAVNHGCAVILKEEDITAKSIIETSEELLTTPLNNELILSKELLANNCNEQINAIKKVMWEKIDKKVKRAKSVDLSKISEKEWGFYMKFSDIYGK